MGVEGRGRRKCAVSTGSVGVKKVLAMGGADANTTVYIYTHRRPLNCTLKNGYNG